MKIREKVLTVNTTVTDDQYPGHALSFLGNKRVMDGNNNVAMYLLCLRFLQQGCAAVSTPIATLGSSREAAHTVH